MTREDIIAEARTWLGTPWHHQGRLKGVGADCVAVVIGVAKRFGADSGYADATDYGTQPDTRMEALLKRYLLPIRRDERQPGDVLHVAWSIIPQHVGILTADNTVIHAYGRRGVVETTFSGRLARGLRGVYRFPNTDG